MTGYVWQNSRDIAVARLNSDGTLDASFGTGGLVILGAQDLDESSDALIILPDGRILLAGEVEMNDGGSDFALTMLLGDGNVDFSFQQFGWQTTDFAGGEDAPEAMIFTGAKLIVAGSIFDANEDFGLARYSFPRPKLGPPRLGR